MTQKRFRKLLMSKGYERNAINGLVKETIKSGKPYSEVYKAMTAFENINISRCIDAVADACKKLQIIVAACAKAVSAAASAFYDAMKEGGAYE